MRLWIAVGLVAVGIIIGAVGVAWLGRRAFDRAMGRYFGW